MREIKFIILIILGWKTILTILDIVDRAWSIAASQESKKGKTKIVMHQALKIETGVLIFFFFKLCNNSRDSGAINKILRSPFKSAKG